MCKVRWSLALLVGLVAACSAPGAAIAPSDTPQLIRAGLNFRPIATVATTLVEPLELRGLVATPISVVRSDAGEQRIRQLLVGAGGIEALRVESALDGSLRLIAKSGVPFEGGGLTPSVAAARALRHLLRVGLEIPAGGPSVRAAAGRTLVTWTRQVRGVPVPNDGIRVVLNGAGALVGISIEESPLAAPPARIVPGEGAVRAATGLLPSGTSVDESPVLAWVAPTEEGDELTIGRVLRRLAWCVRGEFRDGTEFEMQLDAGSLALLGWDGAP